MASEHVIPRSNAAARRNPPVPAGLTAWHCLETASLSAGFFAPTPECNFSENGSVSKLSGSGQGFSLTSLQTETAGWIHKRAVWWTICLLTGGNIGSHQRVVSGEWHRPAWGGTCGPTRLLICPGHGDEGAAARAAIWPWPGNWVARRASCVSGTPSGRLRTDVVRCVCSGTTLEGRRVYQWLQASRRTAESDLGAADVRPGSLVRLTRSVIKWSDRTTILESL